MAPLDRNKPQPNITPSTRITVAFPFSSIKIEEPDDRLRELAAIVAELTDRLEALEQSEAGHELQERARGLLAEIAS